jgi:hypothetical protein
MARSNQKVCPKCGSLNTKEVSVADQTFVVVPGRRCQDCGHEFTPPMPGWQRWTLIILGLFAVTAGGLMLAHWYVYSNRPGVMVVNPGYALFFMGVGLMGLVFALRGLFRHRTVPDRDSNDEPEA